MAEKNPEVIAVEDEARAEVSDADVQASPEINGETTSVVELPPGRMGKFIRSEAYLVFVGILALMAFLLGVAALASNAGQDTSPGGFQREDRGSISDRLPGFPEVEQR